MRDKFEEVFLNMQHGNEQNDGWHLRCFARLAASIHSE